MQSSSLGGYSLVGAGSVAELDSNTVAVVDNNGIDVFDKSGQFIGTMGNDFFAHSTGNIETTITGTNLVFYNNSLYYQSGVRYGSPQHVSAVSLSHLQLVTGAPQSHRGWASRRPDSSSWQTVCIPTRLRTYRTVQSLG